MSHIGRVIDAYRPSGESEIAHLQRLRDALAHTDARSRDAPLHVTGSALVVHPPSRTVLLRWHPRQKMWMQVGGHFDAGESDPWLVALREAREETGLTDLHAPSAADAEQPVQIVIVPVPAWRGDPAHEHADFRYLLVTENPDETVAESSTAPLRWVDLAVAIDEASEENLRVFLTRVSQTMESRYPRSRGRT
jgi:8-oxo-dGTP pyrophosphatase MutT (NUDIX family)